MVTQPQFKRLSPMSIVTIVGVSGNGNSKNGLLNRIGAPGITKNVMKREIAQPNS
jgi:hypothetical protein